MLCFAVLCYAMLGLGLAAAAPKVVVDGSQRAVGGDDDVRAGSVCGGGDLRAVGVAPVPHLHGADDHRVLPEPNKPLEG